MAADRYIFRSREPSQGIYIDPIVAHSAPAVAPTNWAETEYHDRQFGRCVPFQFLLPQARKPSFVFITRRFRVSACFVLASSSD
jgi:hypothetical protein